MKFGQLKILFFLVLVSCQEDKEFVKERYNSGERKVVCNRLENGKLRCKEFSINGSLTSEFDLLNEKFEGKVILYDSLERKIKESNYKEGLKQGEEIKYNYKLQRYSSQIFDKDLPDGPHKGFTMDGRPDLVGNYKEGLRVGFFDRYDEMGNIIWSREFWPGVDKYFVNQRKIYKGNELDSGQSFFYSLNKGDDQWNFLLVPYYESSSYYKLVLGNFPPNSITADEFEPMDTLDFSGFQVSVEEEYIRKFGVGLFLELSPEKKEGKPVYKEMYFLIQ